MAFFNARSDAKNGSHHHTGPESPKEEAMNIFRIIRQFFCIHSWGTNYFGKGCTHRICWRCKADQIAVKLQGREVRWIDYRKEEW